MNEKKQLLINELADLQRKEEAGVSLSEKSVIEERRKVINAELEEIEAETRRECDRKQIEQAHEERVTTAVGQFDQMIEDLDLGGMTLREVIGGVSEYQLVTIELKKVFSAQADSFSKQINDYQFKFGEQERASQDRESQLQRQNESLQATVRKLQAENEESIRLLNQEKMDRANAEQTRDNAMAQLDEQKKDNDRLKSHIDDLRKEIAVGARAAIQVVDTEEEEQRKKELAEKIRKERTVYNREWVNEIRKDRYKAYLAATGEEIQFPWTEQSKYFVIDESEVPQFRQQYAIEQQVVESDKRVDQEPVQSSNVAGGQFPTIPTPSVPHVGAGAQLVAGDANAAGAVATKTTEERIAALEIAVFGKANVA